MPETLITSRKNQRLCHLKKLGASADYRRERGEYLCDGLKLLEEAVKWGADIREVLTCEPLPLELPSSVRVYRTSRELIAFASPLKTAQTVLFSVGMPKREERVGLAGAVILENLQDPGNVGTILRTANAFDIPAVILTGDCADLYNPKTVRASMGAVFRQRAVTMTLDELAALSKTTPLYGAALHRDSQDLRTLPLDSAAVAVGNEGAGLSEALLDLCAGTVLIPMTAQCESLNAAVAASVIMWEMGKGTLARKP